MLERQRRWRFGLFLVCGGVIALAASFSASREATRWGDCALPGFCIFRGVTGIDCPTCGGTRAFAFLLDGDLRSGWAMHRIAPFALGATITVGAYCGLSRALDRAGRIPWSAERRVFKLLLLGFAVAFFVNWILRLCGV